MCQNAEKEKGLDQIQMLTGPHASCIHAHVHGEPWVRWLIKVYHKYVSAQAGHSATQGNLVLQKQEQL